MSIVLKLQKKCLGKDEDLQSLLREALLISTKLKLDDFREWIQYELKGYDKIDNIPKYREVKQTLKFLNPYHGWQIAQLNQEIEDAIGTVNLQQSIIELEHLLLSEYKTLSITPSASQGIVLRKAFDTDCQAAFFLSKASVYGIIEQVRNLLLEWTLKLEEDGILGNDDLIFSEKEKEAAKNIHIENFNGVMGDIGELKNMSTGDYSQNTYNENKVSEEIDKLITEIKKLGLKDEQQVIIDLEESKTDCNKAKSILGGLLARGSEIGSIGSMIIGILGLL